MNAPAPRKDVVTTIINQDAKYTGFSHLFPKGCTVRVKSRTDDYKNKRVVYHTYFSHPHLGTGTEIVFDGHTLKNVDYTGKAEDGPFNITLDLSNLDLSAVPETPVF
jgi:hypothetical protein